MRREEGKRTSRSQEQLLSEAATSSREDDTAAVRASAHSAAPGMAPASSSDLAFAVAVSASSSAEDKAFSSETAARRYSSAQVAVGARGDKQTASGREDFDVNLRSLTTEQQAEWIAQSKPKSNTRGRKRKAPLLWMEEDRELNTEQFWASLGVEEQRAISTKYEAEEAKRSKTAPATERERSDSPKGKKKLGRPAGKTPISGPAKTVAASTNAEKRQKIKNLFRKVASVDLCTDVEDSTPDDPSTKFVLVQVSTAPAPPIEGGGPHRKVAAEKVKTVTIYGGPSHEDLTRTLEHATTAMSGARPDDYKISTLHNMNEVNDHFRRIEEKRKLSTASRKSP